MAKSLTRDTGIVATVPVGPLPLPRKGGARLGGIVPRDAAVAIHAGETEADARAFADALRASYARYIETGRTLGPATGKDATGVRKDRDQVGGFFEPRAYVSKRSDGLVDHRCEASGRDRVRAKYLTRGEGWKGHCPACAPDRSAVRASHSIPCAECGQPWHTSYTYGRSVGHDYRPAALGYTVPELRMVDVPRILPADLYAPIEWPTARKPEPRRPEPSPEPTRKAPRKPAARKAPTRKPAAPRKAAPQPEPAPVAQVAPTREALAPCPRCARTDWQTAKGRDWHIANNPDCTRFVNRERHAYAA